MTDAVAVSSRARVRPLVEPWLLLLVVTGLAGIALRILVYGSTLGNEDSDEAILGLMVRHAEHGELTAFLWGQAYGGSLEVLLTVPVFWLAGSSVLALRCVPVLLDLVTVYLVWRVGRRTIGEPAARTAAALWWVWPAWSVYEHVHQFGFYASGAFFCALILLLALRAKEKPTAVRVGLVGLISGLAVYQTLQIVPIVIAVAVWLGWRERRCLRYAWVAAILAVVGALPALAWNLRHGWASLHLETGASFSYSHRLRIFLSPVLPEDIGLRFVDSQRWIVPGLVGVTLYVGLFLLFAAGAVRARGRDVMIVYLTAAAFPFLVALSPKAIALSDPRYAMVLGPCLAVIVAQPATTYRRAAAVLVIAFALSAIGLRGADDWRVTHANVTGPTTPRSLAPLVATLDRLHVRRVFANYWLAYRLSFDSNERIVAVENGFDRLAPQGGDVLPLRDPAVRWRPYEDDVRAAPHAYVFFTTYLPDRVKLAILARHGYRRYLVDGFTVYARPTRR